MVGAKRLLAAFTATGAVISSNLIGCPACGDSVTALTRYESPRDHAAMQLSQLVPHKQVLLGTELQVRP